jgi:hypothetical protein
MAALFGIGSGSVPQIHDTRRILLYKLLGLLQSASGAVASNNPKFNDTIWRLRYKLVKARRGGGGVVVGTKVQLTGAGTAGANQTYTSVSSTEYDGTGGWQINEVNVMGLLWEVVNGATVYYHCGPSVFPTGPWFSHQADAPPTGVYIS